MIDMMRTRRESSPRADGPSGIHAPLAIHMQPANVPLDSRAAADMVPLPLFPTRRGLPVADRGEACTPAVDTP